MNESQTKDGPVGFRWQFSLKTLLLLMIASAIGVAYWSDRPVELESSSIRTVQYNGWKDTLDVEFTSGETYRYYEVPREKYQGFLESKSHGGYFHREIKGGNYEYELID